VRECFYTLKDLWDWSGLGPILLPAAYGGSRSRRKRRQK
jgi:hypothetical protein